MVSNAAANTEQDVINGKTDLTSAATYSPAGVPTATTDLTFKGTYSSGGNRTFFISGNTSLNAGTLDDVSASPLTIENATSGTASTLTLNGGTDAVSGSSAGDLIYLGSTGQSLTIGVGSVGTMTLSLATSGNIDIGATSTLTLTTGTTLAGGANPITKTGAGTLAFGASALNTSSGGFTIANGTVTVAGTNNNILGATGNTVYLGQTSSANNANLSFSSTPTGLLANVVTQGTGVDTITSSTTSGSGTVFAGTQTFTLNNTTNALVLADTGTSASGNLEIDSAIGGSGGIAIGSSTTNAGVVTFGATAGNTYSGGTTISSGTLAIATSTGGLGTGGVDLGGGGSAGATLKYTSIDTAVGNNFTVSGSGTDTIQRTPDSNSNLTFNGTFLLNNTLTLTGTRASGAQPRFVFTNTLSGTGGLTLSATNYATVFLTGSNTYTGTTTINGTTSSNNSTSTLSLGQNGTTGSLSTSSAIVDNEIFQVYRTNTVTQGTDFTGSAITGTGAFIQNGSGTTIFTAANAYTGTTTIAAGTLQLGNAGTTGSISTSSAITDNGTLAFNRTNTVTQGTDFTASAISGTGKLTQAGSGTTILTAAETYTGATTISAGVLQLGNGGTGLASGSLSTSSAIADNATFAINRADTVTQGTDFSAAAITGTGGLSTIGAGTTVLTAANTYSGVTTINSGSSLQLGGTNGAVAGTVTDNGTFTAAESVSSTIGAISGTGSFATSGTGNTTLTAATGGSNSYTGSTTIGSGTTLTLASGAKITGTSSITDNGTLAFNVGSNTPSQGSNLNSKAITGTGGLSLTSSTGTATLTLTSANTYTGTTQINSGTVVLGTGGELAPSGAIVDNGGFTVNRTTNAVQGTDFSSSAITGTGAFSQSGTATTTLNAANTYSGATTVTAGTLVLADATGKAAGSTGSVAVNAGTLMFSTANQLNAAAAISLGTASTSGTLSAANGASQGSAATVTGGTVAPGTGTPAGTVTTGTPSGTTTQGLGALTLNSTATLAYNSGISTQVFGTFTPNGNVLNISGYTNTTAQTAGNSGVDGTDDRLVFQGDQENNFADFNFNGAGAGVGVGEVMLDGGFYEVTYTTPVPEPATWAAGILSLGALGFGVRRRLARAA